jgi:putative transposase
MKKNTDYRGFRYPPGIIGYAVWLYHRFTLSFRDIENLLAYRGVIVSYEAIRLWCIRFGPSYARRLRKKSHRFGDHWYLDEISTVTIHGIRMYLWRAVDQDGDLIDVLVQQRKDKRAAKRFFRKMIKHQGVTPNRITTDKLRSYGAAKRDVMPSVVHCQDRYANNRAEVSHQPTRQQERQMRRFKSLKQAQRFLSVHGVVNNLFRFGRHLIRACHYRMFRAKAISEWQQVTCACPT